jgi:hypothetical protein
LPREESSLEKIFREPKADEKVKRKKQKIRKGNQPRKIEKEEPRKSLIKKINVLNLYNKVTIIST